MKKQGKITVNIQREERLEAINMLSMAIFEVAKALNTPINVQINDCTIQGAGVGVCIRSTDEVDTETLSMEFETDGTDGEQAETEEPK